MKKRYSVNMSQIMKDSLIKKTDIFNFAKARGNNKRLNSNKPRYEFDFEHCLIISILELAYRIRGNLPSWGKFYAVNDPAFIGFDEKFTNKFFTFCNYLEEKLSENDGKVKLSQAQVYTIFDILSYASVMHNKLKRSRADLFKYLPKIKVHLLFGLKMKDLKDESFLADAIPLEDLKKMEIIY